MSIYDFIEDNINIIQTEIIDNLDQRFNSHDFIQRFSKLFEPDYIDFLNEYRGEGAFNKVHSQIAKSLSKNEQQLDIVKTHRVRDKNIFGHVDEIQQWRKI